MDADSYLKQFREWMQAKGHPPQTVTTYLSGAKRFFDYFQSSDHPKNVSVQQIIGFLASEENAHTRKSFRCSVKLFYTAIIHQPNKFDKIPPVKVPDSLPVILTPEEIYAIIESKKDNIKHQTILQLMYSGALRISEPVNVKITHLYKQYDPLLAQDTARLHIVGAKGNKDRLITLPMETYNLVETYKQQHKPTPAEYLFNGQNNSSQYSTTSIRAIFNEACYRAEIIKDVTPHSMRHSRATHLLEGGMDLFYVKELLGHKRIETTMIYLHCSPAAMDRAMHSADNYVKAMAQKIPLRQLRQNSAMHELAE